MINDIGVQTVAFHSSIPEVFHRGTLQHQEEPENESDNGRQGNIDPKDDHMDLADSQAKEGEGDRYLCSDACQDIGTLAEPPPLWRM